MCFKLFNKKNTKKNIKKNKICTDVTNTNNEQTKKHCICCYATDYIVSNYCYENKHTICGKCLCKIQLYYVDNECIFCNNSKNRFLLFA
jgi:hypothetical protein